MRLARQRRRAGDETTYRACRKQIIRLYFQQGLTALARAVDDLLYRGYRNTPIDAPLFIAAPARSGTTLLFNLLARDPQFTCMRTYQTQLPAISIDRLIQRIARLDKPLRGRLSRLLERMNEEVSRFEDVHRTRLEEPEEDSGLFLGVLVEPNINLVFPFGHELDHRWYLDDFEAVERDRVMDYYVASLKRHVYDAPGKRLLVKNTHAAGRLDCFRRAFPDLRVVNIVRHPYRSVPASISLAATGYRAMTGLEPKHDAPEWRAIADATIEYYLRLARFEREFPPEQWISIRFDELVSEPFATAQRIYAHFGLEMSEAAASAVANEVASSARHRSRDHRYSLEEFGLTRDQVSQPLGEIFERYEFEA